MCYGYVRRRNAHITLVVWRGLSRIVGRLYHQNGVERRANCLALRGVSACRVSPRDAYKEGDRAYQKEPHHGVEADLLGNDA